MPTKSSSKKSKGVTAEQAVIYLLLAFLIVLSCLVIVQHRQDKANLAPVPMPEELNQGA